jgi:hypothetical protein
MSNKFAIAVCAGMLVLASAGTGYAAAKLPKNSVGTVQIKKNAVTGAKVKDGSLVAADLSAEALTSLKGPAGSVGPAGAAGTPGLSSSVAAGTTASVAIGPEPATMLTLT